MIIFLLISTVLSVLESGYVLSVLWGWFIVPFFHLPTLPLVYAMGIAIIIDFALFRMSTHKDDRDKKQQIIDVVIALIMPFWFLLIGWIIYLFL